MINITFLFALSVPYACIEPKELFLELLLWTKKKERPGPSSSTLLDF